MLKPRYEIDTPDGRPLVLRPVEKSDAQGIAEAVRNMSERSRYFRFHSAGLRLGPRELDYLSDVDGIDHVAWAMVHRDTGEGAGLGRYYRDGDHPGTAEIALTVVDAYQGQGLSKLLLAVLMLSARSGGIETFRASVLNDNARMRTVLDALGAECRPGEPGTLEAFAATDPEALPATALSDEIRTWCRRLGTLSG